MKGEWNELKQARLLCQLQGPDCLPSSSMDKTISFSRYPNLRSLRV